MKNKTKEFSKSEKIKFNLGQILKAIGGFAIIVFILTNNGLYYPESAETIGADIFALVIISLGGWMIYSAIKNWKK